MTSEGQVTSFISFDVEALPGRAKENPLERLVWGELNGSEFGIRRISKILEMHKLKGNFLIDLGICLLYGDKQARRICDFLLEQGHEVHAHLHSEWVVRKWGLTGQWSGPLGLDRTDSSLSDALMQFSAWKYHSLTGLEPGVFRSGSYLFSEKTIAAAGKSGFRALSNYNSTRHAHLELPEAALNNAPFLWNNLLLELPVDFSPEPLSFDWTKYIGWFDRCRLRKQEKTFNLVMHSWSLLKRNGETFDQPAHDHEERLHQICEHLVQHTNPQGYSEFLATRATAPRAIMEPHACALPAVELASALTTCSICGYGFTAQAAVDTCPGCGARARHRQLRDVLSRMPDPFAGKVVLASYANGVEMRAFLQTARSVLNFDVRPVSEVELQMDVQDMSPVRSASIDVFFSLHVLNHVQDDEQALREVSRVLKPGGVACLTIPYRDRYSTTALDDVTEHYGKDALEKYGVGTFRRYGLSDARTLFGKYFDVETEDGFDPVTGQSMLIFFLRKRPASLEGAAPAVA